MNHFQSPKEAIKKLKDSNDIGIKYHIIWWLGKHKCAESLPILCDIININNDQIELGGFPLRRQAARSLGMIADRSSIPTLINALSSSDLRLQEASLLALKAIGEKRIVPDLIKYVQASSKLKPLEILIETLAFFEVWEMAEIIQNYLDDPSQRVQGAAGIFFYRMTRDPQYLGALKINLSDENAFLRQSAAFDLAQCNDPVLKQMILPASLPNNVKMASLKQMLENHISAEPKNSRDSQQVDAISKEILLDIDRLIANAAEGNLPPHNSSVQHNKGGSSLESDTRSQLITALNSNNKHYHGLIAELKTSRAPDSKLLTKVCLETPDQDIRAAIVQFIYVLACPQVVPIQQSVIGLEVANHCQGKLRRVAILALGRIYSSAELSTESKRSIQQTLEWAYTTPDDWGLRYAAVMAYETMGMKGPLSFNLLTDATKACQSNMIVMLRSSVAESAVKTSQRVF